VKKNTPFPRASQMRKILNPPNLVSISRLVLTLVICVLAYFAPEVLPVHQLRLDAPDCSGSAQPWYNLILVLFILTAATDWLDGYLARKYNQVTQIGRILDPVVDKTLIFAGFLIVMGKCPGLIPFWIVLICLAREFVGTGIRTALEGQGKAFGAQWSGKLKAVCQFTAIGWCFLEMANGVWIAEKIFGPAWGNWEEYSAYWEKTRVVFQVLDWVFLGGMLLVVLYSFVDYTWRGIRLLKSGEKNSSPEKP
jgi:CDP-diacylglycerol--glycerol-3-phosphate 3-phosphatidyltransferase